MKTITEICIFRDTFANTKLSNEELFDKVAHFVVPNFKITDENKNFFEQLKCYFNNEKGFEGDLERGLLVLGGFGVGKTAAMEICSIYSLIKQNNKYFALYDSDTIIDRFSNNGRVSIREFDNWGDICIDELGEDTGKHIYYGSPDDPVEVLISRRYNQFKSNGFRLHGISNLDVNMLQNRFSPKIYDRMCEMFNLLVLEGSSWRRKFTL